MNFEPEPETVPISRGIELAISDIPPLSEAMAYEEFLRLEAEKEVKVEDDYFPSDLGNIDLI
jgi:hypothetical protein